MALSRHLKDINDDNLRPKRASRLLAEKKLHDLTNSRNDDAISSSEGCTDFDSSEEDSDFGENDEEMDGELEEDQIDSSLEKMRNTQRRGNKIYFCQSCNKNFSRLDRYKEHLLTVSHIRCVGGEDAVLAREQQLKFVCNTCNKKYVSATSLGNHVRSHKRNLVRHENNKEPDQLLTQNAKKPKKSTNGTSNGSEESPNLACSEGESDKEEDEIDEEIETVPSQEEGGVLELTNPKLPFICKQCGRGYNRHYSLVVHERDKQLHLRLRKLAKKSGRSIFSAQRNHKRTTISPYQKLGKSINVSPVHTDRVKSSKIVTDRFTCKKCGRSFRHETNWHRHEKDTKLHELLEKRARKLGKDVFQLQRERKPRKPPTAPDPLTCLKCFVKFPNVETKLSHELVLASGKYKCDMCDMYYCSEELRVKHLSTLLHFWSEECRKVSDNGDVIYACDLCNEEFVFLKDLASHKREFHPRDEFFCKPCNKQLRDSYRFQRHILAAPHLRCVGGEEAVWNLQQHKKFVCDICDKKYMTTKLLRQHIQGHKKFQKNPQFVCELCGKKLATSSALKAHLKTHAAAPKPGVIKIPNRFIEKPITCKKCPKRFLNERKMYKHLKECGIRVTCDICLKDFERKETLQNHKNRVHFGKKKKPVSQKGKFTCEICPKTLTTNQKLTCHMELKHFSDKDFCPYGCSDKIENAEEWKLHLESCKSEKITEQSKCKCWFCGEIFRTRLLLFEHHLRLHKSFPCEFCSLTFTKPGALRLHQIQHEESKPYLCPKCGKRFRTDYSLSVHSAAVCGDDEAAREEFIKKRRERHRIFGEKAKAHKCDLCSRGFTEETRLLAHKLKVHQNLGKESETEDGDTSEEEEVA